MPVTRGGVYHNLKESKYTVSNTEIVYFFSSHFYMMKFLDEYKDHRESFKRRFAKIVVENPYNMDMFADISLYLSIEKRGFHVWLKGVEITCQNLYQYGLRRMTVETTLDWSRIPKPRLEERKRIMESTYQQT